MQTIAKNINSIENGVLKYIFNKYIIASNILDSTNSPDTKEQIEEEYKKFVDTIINKKRIANYIPQDEIILNDIKNIKAANADYEANQIIDKQKNGSLPDIFRCTYIRKYKNRYYRCNNQIIDDNSDICRVHEYSENIYYDQYNELYEKLSLTPTI